MLTCPPSPRHFFPSPRAAAASAHLPPPQPSPELNPRNHNSKSSDLLLRHLSTQHSDHPHCHVHSSPSSTTAGVSDEDRSKLLELSLIRRRTPQFPGSIYAQSPSDADVAASLPALRSLVASDADEDEMIMKAVEIRRRVTAEILKQAMMRKGKFGITYSQNMVEILGEFVDYVMIEAASLKRLPQYSDSTFNLRAMTVVEDSKVVHLMRWLKRNSVSYPQIGKLICRTKGNLELIPRLAEWLKSVHVKGELIGPVMLKPGEKVLWRPIEELEEMVTFLEGNGVRREWMGYVLTRCPQILSMDMEELKSRVAFFVDMGMNQKDFGTMVFDYPRVLGFYSLVEMSEKVNYLKEFGISDEEVRKLLAFKPQLMGCGIEERWKPLVKYFYYFGITREGLKRVLLIKPMVFCIDIEITIVPKVKFFQDIGIRNEAIGNMLAKFPSLLTYSLYKKIRPVVIFLITRAGVTERNIGKVIAAAPELLGCSISRKLDVNMKYFLSLGIRVRQLGDMIADFPMLLRYNVELHRPKYRYLRRTMVRSLKDLIEFPRFLSYSLEDRIIPRHEVLVENRINMKLRNMLACTDEEFKKKVEAIKERRQIFESSTATSSVLQNQEEIDNDHDSLEEEKLVDWSESETES